MFDDVEICAMNFHYSRYPIEVFLDDVVRLDIKTIELWGAAPHFYIGDNGFSEIKALKTAIDKRGLQLACFTPEQCVYPIDIAARDLRLRDRSIQYFMDCINVSAQLDSPAVLITPGFGFMNEDLQEVRARSLDALDKIARYAQGIGIKLYLEPLPAAYSKIIQTSQELRIILDEIDSPALYGMIDTACAHVIGETIADYGNNLGDRLGHIHMIDTDNSGAHLAWGDGKLPLADYLNQIKQASYHGAISLEIIGPRYHQDPFIPLRQSVEMLRSHSKA